MKQIDQFTGQERFGEVVDAFEPMIHSIIQKLNIYKNKDDYFQIGLIALWKAYKRFKKEKGKFSTYAYHYIRGSILVELRKNAQQERVEYFSENNPLENILDPTNHFELLHIEELISYLPKKFQYIIILYYFEGLPLKEIAKLLNISYATSKLWKRQAIERLAKLFHENNREFN
ncbi:sigma-70 family RNA polymerase sigma factor [Bacillus kwashiorkori]|uniref:sigma-70 family RNA polymerase sigma factor n=1 Tax=Bacillus kwashiorkori TaxID=1522318 RepID=UPI000783F7BC|nr:sigma-70 family RNA polymerase sigma factor [Bacillus kwashiorkori]